MKSKSVSKIQLASYDELFGCGSGTEEVIEIPVSELSEFKNHPFHVLDDENMNELLTSISEKGILEPLLLRTCKTGGYEILSGHRRRYAAQKLGLSYVPAIIKDVSDQDAIDIMVYSNLHRPHILPSEKAFAYKMQVDAMKHPGVKGNATADAVGKKYGDNARKVQRYIRLTFLNPHLLELVDAKKMTMQAAYNISYLSDDIQTWIDDIFCDNNKLPSGKQAEQLRTLYEQDNLSQETLEMIILGKEKKKGSLTFSYKHLREYFPENYDFDMIEKIMLELLENWRLGQH